MDNNLIKKQLENLFQDRGRTNLLKVKEQKALKYFVQRIPQWISSDMLTSIGFTGSIIVFLSFVLGAKVDILFLLMSIPGFFINWFGDSLDGRLAYYRNKPRKWYGFSLDMTVDWLSTALIGWGYLIYVHDEWETIGFFFVVLYGWEMITALLRYKITGKYSIDSGIFGPTELRVVLSIIFIIEVIFPGSIIYSGIIACVILLIMNIKDTLHLLKLGDLRDKEEKALKEAEAQKPQTNVK